MTELRISQTFRVLVFSVLSLTFVGCGFRYQRAVAPIPQSPQVVEVFYATDRTRSEPDRASCKPGKTKLSAPLFGNDRAVDGRLKFGVYSIQIPARREMGELLDYVRRPICLKGDSHPLYLKGPTPEPGDEFWQAIANRLAAAQQKRILVFVHGYNYDFDEAVLWAAQFKQDLQFDGVEILYSWPSLRSRFRYVADRTNAEWSTPHLAQFLEELASHFRGTEIQLFAHSMGGEALVDALHQIATESRNKPLPNFGQLVLAAPDIDSWILRERIAPVLPLARRVTLYASRNDKALLAAGRLHGYPRAGDAEHDLVLIPGIDTVDVTFVDRTRVGHNYYIENRAVLTDLFELLRNATPPEKRFGLVKVPTDSGVLWAFRK